MRLTGGVASLSWLFGVVSLCRQLVCSRVALQLPGSGDGGNREGGWGPAAGVTRFWLCGQSKRPHQSRSTSTSHNLPLLFPSVSVPGGVISHISPERKLDERGRQDEVEVHGHLFLLYLLLERNQTGKKGFGCFVYATKRKE